MGTVPPFHGYYGALRFPAVLPAGLRLPSPRGYRLASGIRSARGTDARPGGREAIQRPLPYAVILRRKRQGLPGSWETPSYTCPALRLRWAGNTRLTTALPMLPSGIRKTSAPQRYTYRSSITQPVYSLSTLHLTGCPVRRKTRYRLPQPGLAGRDWLPAGFHCKVSGQVMAILPAQAWPGALVGVLELVECLRGGERVVDLRDPPEPVPGVVRPRPVLVRGRGEPPRPLPGEGGDVVPLDVMLTG